VFVERSSGQGKIVCAGCILAAALLCLGATRARAQLTAGAGIEFFRWTEDTQPKPVEEHGPLAAIELGWTQPGPQALRFAYLSKYYLGWVRYEGSHLFAQAVPATGASRHVGTFQEGQARFGFLPTADVYCAVGIDLWQRRLSTRGKEDFRIGYVRFGVGSAPAKREGWVFDAGLKSPVGAREDAHLTDIGFDQNPRLRPDGDLSGFGQLGYRLDRRWTLAGYLDGFHFKPSGKVRVTSDGIPRGAVFQPGGALEVVGLRLAYRF